MLSIVHDKPPAAVRTAISNFQAGPNLTIRPPSRADRSIIHKWGVRLEFRHEGESYIGWVCLANETCRNNQKTLLLSGGKTSKATKHLRIDHSIVSPKTVTETERREERSIEIDRLRSSSLYRINPRRFNLLLETLRIVNNNLPLRVGEYLESKLKEALVTKDELRTTINAPLIAHSVIELYSSTKNEMISFIREHQVDGCKSLVMMTDFWTCKTSRAKYLGLRVYMIDNEWELRSMLLATRRFRPSFGERDSGIRGPFLAWINRILEDFQLDTSKFFGATSDAGSDVKSMLCDTLGLQWEWCIAHMTHAATKAACGLEIDLTKSKNLPVTEMLLRLRKTIYHVRSVEKTGDLFAQLCASLTSTRSTRLLDYDSSRFLSATSSIERVLDKWPALLAWYDQRREQALRQRMAPPSFPLANDKNDLIQLLSLLAPISRVLRMCQGVDTNQVDVLIKLYLVRLHSLRLDEQLKDYRSTRETPRWVDVSMLTPTIIATRKKLRDAFDERFFSRYTDPDKMRKASFLFELQQRFHPKFKRPQKSLYRVVRQCCRDKGLSTNTAQQRIQQLSEIITIKMRELLQAAAGPEPDVEPTSHAQNVLETDVQEFSDDVSEFVDTMPPQQQPVRSDVNQAITDELNRWANDWSQLRLIGSTGEAESILDYWKRKEDTGEFRLLPKVARVLFAVPSSAAHIERDFSVSGMMVTTQRTSLSPKNIDMAAFLNRNRDFVDLAQCEEISRSDAHLHTPPETTFSVEVSDMMDDFFDDLDDMIVDTFSNVSIDTGDIDTNT